jgi:predicted NUDIX family NTP pyrophosphohydrolase
MIVQSAGILLFRFKRKKLEILLAHPGGPFFDNKDEGVWSIPKGLCEDNESLLETARREFEGRPALPLMGILSGSDNYG